MSRRSTARATAAAALALLLLLAAGCGGGNDAERAGTEPIRGTKLTIYANAPGGGPDAAPGRAIAQGARLALDERRGRAGRYSVAFKALSGEPNEGGARKSGRVAVQDTTSVGYIGEVDSQLTKITIPQMNLGGVAHIGPTNSYTGLTSGGPGAEVGEPGRYYRTGVRTFARLVPRDSLQGEALALAAREAGCRRVRIWRSNSPYGQGLAKTAGSAAGDAGLDVAGTDEIKPQQPSYARQAREIDADCLIWTGEPERSGVQILNDAAEGNPALKLFSGSEHCQPGPAELPRLQCTHPVVEPRSGRGREVLDRYRDRFGEGGPADAYAVYGYEAMMVLLAAIEKAAEDGGQVSRAAVSEAVYDLGPRDGALGRYEIDSSGDVDLRSFGLYRLEGGRLRLEKVLQAG
ncbi:MAG TPA: branched-chain amino acid ABC transporter substrate-binding protein [Thermoleophilaceae bacterium]